MTDDHLKRIAYATAHRYCRQNGSYDVDDAAQIAWAKLLRVMPKWRADGGLSERDYAITIARQAVSRANNQARHRQVGNAPLPDPDPSYTGIKWVEEKMSPDWVRSVGSEWLQCLGRDDPAYAAADARDLIEYVRQRATPLQLRIMDLLLQGHTLGETAVEVGLYQWQVHQALLHLRPIAAAGGGEPAMRKRGVSRTPQPCKRYGPSQYRGVQSYGRRKWRARIRNRSGRIVNLGSFNTEEAAAHAYDAAAKLYHARPRLNFGLHTNGDGQAGVPAGVAT